MNKKRATLIIIVLLLVTFQWLMVKLVYSHKINGAPAKLLATLYHLKAGTIEDEAGNIDISLKDFFANKEFASKLLGAQATNEKFANLDINNEKISELVWIKLLKQTWLEKIAKENDIEITQEDIDYYINAFGGQDKLVELVDSQGVSMKEYKHFLIESDILEAKVYNHLMINFADQKGVLKIQEAYALLEAEQGKNWDEVVDKYSEDVTLSENSFWLAEDEIINVYEAIGEIEVGEFSKIVQVPLPAGYVIWHLDSLIAEDISVMREVRGLFVHAQSIDDFFDKYVNSVNIKKTY